VSSYLVNAQLLKDHAELGGGSLTTGQLIFDGQPKSLRREEDGVLVTVETNRDAVVLENLVQDLEIPEKTFVGREVEPQDLPGGIIERPVEGKSRPPVLEPGMRGGIDLDQHTLSGHSFSGATPTRRSARQVGDTGGGEDPTNGSGADPYSVVLQQDLRSVDTAGTFHDAGGEFQDSLPDIGPESVSRFSPSVLVGQGSQTVQFHLLFEAPDMTNREAKQRRSLSTSDLSAKDTFHDKDSF
jgi:hypothetical protein